MLEEITGISIEFLCIVQAICIFATWLSILLLKEMIIDWVCTIKTMESIITAYDRTCEPNSRVQYCKYGEINPTKIRRGLTVITGICLVCLVSIPITSYIMVVSK